MAILLDSGASPLVHDATVKRTPLHAACEGGEGGEGREGKGGERRGGKRRGREGRGEEEGRRGEGTVFKRWGNM